MPCEVDDLLEMVKALGPEEALGNLTLTELKNHYVALGLPFAWRAPKLDIIRRLGEHLSEMLERKTVEDAASALDNAKKRKLVSTTPRRATVATPSRAGWRRPRAAEVPEIATTSTSCGPGSSSQPHRQGAPRRAKGTPLAQDELVEVVRAIGLDGLAEAFMAANREELRRHCKNRGLHANGVKKDLVARLRAQFEEMQKGISGAAATSKKRLTGKKPKEDVSKKRPLDQQSAPSNVEDDRHETSTGKAASITQKEEETESMRELSHEHERGMQHEVQDCVGTKTEAEDEANAICAADTSQTSALVDELRKMVAGACGGILRCPEDDVEGSADVQKLQPSDWGVVPAISPLVAEVECTTNAGPEPLALMDEALAEVLRRIVDEARRDCMEPNILPTADMELSPASQPEVTKATSVAADGQGDAECFPQFAGEAQHLHNSVDDDALATLEVKGSEAAASPSRGSTRECTTFTSKSSPSVGSGSSRTRHPKRQRLQASAVHEAPAAIRQATSNRVEDNAATAFLEETLEEALDSVLIQAESFAKEARGPTEQASFENRCSAMTPKSSENAQATLASNLKARNLWPGENRGLSAGHLTQRSDSQSLIVKSRALLSDHHHADGSVDATPQSNREPGAAEEERPVASCHHAAAWPDDVEVCPDGLIFL